MLACGDVEVKGRMPWSSNATFLARVTDGADGFDVIYKPLRGERPLWDFPAGLFRREVAAWVVSELLGWGLVSETVIRHDAPLGVGSLQRFVPADFSQHYFTLLEREEHHDALRRIAAFDLLINNADRKSGHCLLGEDGRIWAIDHGVSFHVEPKLRTVIWDFAGEPVPSDLLADVARMAEGAGREALAELLDEEEVAAFQDRAAAVLRRPTFPAPHPDRRPYPWPLV